MRVRSFGGAGESGSQLSVVKLTNSEMDPSKGRHVADTLNEKKIFFFEGNHHLKKTKCKNIHMQS